MVWQVSKTYQNKETFLIHVIDKGDQIHFLLNFDMYQQLDI